MKRQKSDNLDRMLSSRLKKAVGDEKRADWLDVLGRAGVSRTLWHWSQRRVMLVAGVLVVAVGAAGASTGLIPWLNKEAKSPVPAVYPICKASGVQAQLSLHKNHNSSGLSGSIVLVNSGAIECALEGQPKISLTGSGAGGFPFKAEMFSPNAKRPEAPPTVFGSASDGQTLLARSVEPAGNSTVSFIWENWCGSKSADLSLRLEIPNGTILTLPISKLPACVDRTKPSRLVVGGANSALPPGANVPLRPKILPAKDGEALVIERGKVFHYRIALTNTSSSAYRFGYDCPSYYVSATMTHIPESWKFGGSGFLEGRYVLNCHSVEEIAPGETVTFAMELPASMKAVDAEGELFWLLEIGFPPKEELATRAPITVMGKATPAQIYSALSSGRPEVELPPEIATSVAESWESSDGPIVPGSGRILREKSEQGGPVYIWEMASGGLAYSFQGFGCCSYGSDDMNKPIWLATEGYDSRGKTEIGGFAQDRVKRVDMVVNGEPVQVKVENNTFYAEFTGGENVTAIIATLDDGSKVRIKPHQSDLAGTVPIG